MEKVLRSSFGQFSISIFSRAKIFVLIFSQRLSLVVLLFCFALAGRAQTSINESFGILKINGAANVYYDLQAGTSNPDLQGANLGVFYSSNSLIINGAQNKTSKCGTDNITQSHLYYRIYRTSINSVI